MEDLAQLSEIAQRNSVKRLELFGSAARGKPNPGDYDFLVEFEPMEPLAHGRAYFSLLQSLEQALGAKVDLIELEAIQNPYFLRAIERERVVVYAA